MMKPDFVCNNFAKSGVLIGRASYPWLARSEGMEKKMENYYNGLYSDYYKDPFLHS